MLPFDASISAVSAASATVASSIDACDRIDLIAGVCLRSANVEDRWCSVDAIATGSLGLEKRLVSLLNYLSCREQ